MVPRNEGNEVRREGRLGVGAADMTREGGEPTPGDPAEESGSLGIEHMEGKMSGKQSPGDVSTRLHKIAELARKAPAKGVERCDTYGRMLVDRSRH